MNLIHLAEVFIRFLHCEVTPQPLHPFPYCIQDEVTICTPHLRSRELITSSLKADYLQKLLRIVLHERLGSFPSLIYRVIYLHQYGCFFPCVPLTYPYFVVLLLLILLKHYLALGAPGSYRIFPAPVLKSIVSLIGEWYLQPSLTLDILLATRVSLLLGLSVDSARKHV